MEKIEILFPFDVEEPSAFYKELDDLLTKHFCKPYNKAHPDRVMWVSGMGAKLTFSRIDAALLGRADFDPNIPDGEEPKSDDSITEITISEREK